MSKPLDAEAQSVMGKAQLLHDASAVSLASKRLAEQIAERAAGRNPVILPMMLGGMYAAMDITRHFDFPFELDILQASRYHNATHGSDLVWKVMPSIDLTDRVVVVIDDILDEGHTLKAVELALRAQQPTELMIAVLADKQTPKRVTGVQVDFVGLQVPDRYVFGCGMDYKGYWRQLPGIYAVAGSGA